MIDDFYLGKFRQTFVILLTIKLAQICCYFRAIRFYKLVPGVARHQRP